MREGAIVASIPRGEADELDLVDPMSQSQERMSAKSIFCVQVTTLNGENSFLRMAV